MEVKTKSIGKCRTYFPKGKLSSRDYKTKKSANQYIRLSKLNFQGVTPPLENKYNKLLFDLNVKHNKNFSPKQKVAISLLSDTLLTKLTDLFSLNKEDIYLSSDTQHLIFEEQLTYDYYSFEIKDFLKLKRIAPKLFISFASFFKYTNFPTIEKFETSLFYEEYLEFYMEDIPTSKKKKYLKSINKIKYQYDELNEIGLNKQDAIFLLENYKPKNLLFIEIKNLLLKWFDINFSFIYANPPIQYYKNGQQDYIDDSLEIFNRVFFIYDSANPIYQFIEQSMQETYQNLDFCQPCSTINLKTINIISNDINDFENFTSEFINITELLSKI